MGRKKWIDILKVISAFCIVLLHINSSSSHLVYSLLSDGHKSAANIAHQLLYLAVPVFILLTGAGLFASGKLTYSSMWKHIRKMLICILLFGTAFEISRIVIRKEDITAIVFISDLLNGTTWSHMWYLNKLLGLYLVAPILSAFLRNSSRKEQLIFVALGFAFGSFIPYFAGLIGFSVADIWPIRGTFVALAVLGYIIEQTDINVLLKHKWTYIAGLVISVGAIVCISKDTGTVVLEDNPLACLAVLCIAVLTKIAFKGEVSGAKLEEISRCTLGIYIIHPAFVHVLTSIIKFNPHLHFPVVTVPLTGAIIFILALGVIWTLRKIDFVRKYIV